MRRTVVAVLGIALATVLAAAPAQAEGAHQKASHHPNKQHSEKHKGTASSTPASATVPATLSGTAQPSLTTGKKGQLDIVFVGAPVANGGAGATVPVEVWNGTGSVVSHLQVSGSASSGGKVVGSGSSQDVEPANLSPGDVAFGMVFFSETVPPTSTFSLKVSATPRQSNYFINAKVSATNLVTGTYSKSVVGTITNANNQVMKGPIETDAYCFTGGTLVGVYSGFSSGSSTAALAPGSTTSFSIDIYATTAPCGTYLVGSSGYGKTGL